MNKQEILDQVSACPIQRWEGLRKKSDGSLIPLETDDTLHKQLLGLNNWLHVLRDDFAIAAKKDSEIALAYVARQVLTGGNFLLNNQNATSKKKEAAALRDAADKMPANDSSLAATFRLVADTLDKNDTDLSEEARKVKEYMAAANRLFYLESGVEAAKMATKQVAGSDEEKTALLLAANAFGNNFSHIGKNAAESRKYIMNNTDDKTYELIMTRIIGNTALFDESVQKAKATPQPKI